MPYWRVGWIRVTHPCAGRQQTVQAQSLMPLDLHVLSLPLAFILSQDQTLHCIFYIFETPEIGRALADLCQDNLSGIKLKARSLNKLLTVRFFYPAAI